MNSSRNEKAHRVCSIVSGILQIAFWFLIAFSAIYPAYEIFTHLTTVCLLIAFLALISLYCMDYLKRKQFKRDS